jgi:hypothetical protein
MKIWLTGILVVLLGAAAYYYFKIYVPELEQQQAPPPLVETAPPPPEPAYQPVAPAESSDSESFEYESAPVVTEEPLPLLAQSDPIVLDSIAEVIGEDTVMRNVVSEGVVSRVVAAIDALTSAQVPGIIIPVQPVGGEFEATEDQNPEFAQTTADGDPIPQYILDPVNYQRFNSYAEMVEAIDVEQLIDNYHEMYPLFQQSYEELGYSDGNFTQRLLEVIDEMLATPEPDPPVRLIKTEAVFQFRDPQLERLSAGQKALIRMGPDNASRIKAKLVELRAALERL